MINLRNLPEGSLEIIEKSLTIYEAKLSNILRHQANTNEEEIRIKNDLTLINQIYDQFPASINKIKD